MRIGTNNVVKLAGLGDRLPASIRHHIAGPNWLASPISPWLTGYDSVITTARPQRHFLPAEKEKGGGGMIFGNSAGTHLKDCSSRCKEAHSP